MSKSKKTLSIKGSTDTSSNSFFVSVETNLIGRPPGNLDSLSFDFKNISKSNQINFVLQLQNICESYLAMNSKFRSNCNFNNQESTLKKDESEENEESKENKENKESGEEFYDEDGNNICLKKKKGKEPVHDNDSLNEKLDIGILSKNTEKDDVTESIVKYLAMVSEVFNSRSNEKDQRQEDDPIKKMVGDSTNVFGSIPSGEKDKDEKNNGKGEEINGESDEDENVNREKMLEDLKEYLERESDDENVNLEKTVNYIYQQIYFFHQNNE